MNQNLIFSYNICHNLDKLCKITDLGPGRGICEVSHKLSTRNNDIGGIKRDCKRGFINKGGRGMFV